MNWNPVSVLTVYNRDEVCACKRSWYLHHGVKHIPGPGLREATGGSRRRCLVAARSHHTDQQQTTKCMSYKNVCPDMPAVSLLPSTSYLQNHVS